LFIEPDGRLRFYLLRPDDDDSERDGGGDGDRKEARIRQPLRVLQPWHEVEADDRQGIACRLCPHQLTTSIGFMVYLIRLDLLLLQGAQSTSTFFSVLLPPFATGMM